MWPSYLVFTPWRMSIFRSWPHNPLRMTHASYFVVQMQTVHTHNMQRSRVVFSSWRLFAAFTKRRRSTSWTCYESTRDWLHTCTLARFKCGQIVTLPKTIKHVFILMYAQGIQIDWSYGAVSLRYKAQQHIAYMYGQTTSCNQANIHSNCT